MASALGLDEGEDGVGLEADGATDSDVPDAVLQGVRLCTAHPEGGGDLPDGEELRDHPVPPPAPRPSARRASKNSGVLLDTASRPGSGFASHHLVVETQSHHPPVPEQ